MENISHPVNDLKTPLFSFKGNDLIKEDKPKFGELLYEDKETGVQIRAGGYEIDPHILALKRRIKTMGLE